MEATMDSSASVVSLTFEDQDTITSKELSEFLYHFRLAYGASLQVAGKDIGDVDTLLKKRGRLSARTLQELASRSAEQKHKDFYLEKLGDEELVVERINKESPLLVVFSGVLAAVTLAAIISGGEVKAKAPGFGLEFRLPPLGDGLRKLISAFHQSDKSTKSYKENQEESEA